MPGAERVPLLPPAPVKVSRDRKRLLVAVTMLTSFLATIDLTIVATCVPTIASELKAFDKEAWIGTAYLWSNVTFTPLYGRLSDAIGQRAAYTQALVLFTVGTLLCGIAPNITCLAIARFIAGMGGGGAGTVSSIILAHAFPAHERGFYQGLSFAVFGFGLGVGGPLGGWLTQKFGWRVAFGVQVPVALACLLLSQWAVPKFNSPEDETKGEKKWSINTLRQLDLGGGGTLLIAVGALLQLLQHASEGTLSDPTAIVAAAVAGTFFVAFVYVELRVAVKPILPLSLLQRRTSLCVGIISAMIAIVNFNMLFRLPMVFEIVFGQNLSLAGAHILPNSAAMTLAAPLAGLLVKRTGRYKNLTVLFCAGPAVAMALLTTLTPASSWAVQWLSVLPMGAGFSGLLTLTLIANLNAVPKSEIATATGFVFVFRSLGQVFGVGISGAVFQSTLATELGKSFSDPEIIDKLRKASKAIDKLAPAQQLLARAAYSVALRNTFVFGLGGALLVFATSLFIPDEKVCDAEEDKAGELEA